MFTEALTPFFSTAGFAESATLGGVAVTGIVDAGYEDPTLAGMGVAGSSPKFTLPASSVPAHPEGLALVILTGSAAGTYKVRSAYPDGTGVIALNLLPQIT